MTIHTTAWVAQHQDGHTVPVVIDGDSMTYTADAPGRWQIILRPKPPTLREQVAKAWCAEFYGESSRSAQSPDPDQLEAADAVLAVVADWLAAQPLDWPASTDAKSRRIQRDHDVRLLRGES